MNMLSDFGFKARQTVSSIGYAARLFLSVFRAFFRLLARPRLITDQIFFIGNILSFVILRVI